MTATEESIRNLLDKLNTELCNAGCVVECETREERQRLINAVKDKYAQAIAATVGAGTCKLVIEKRLRHGPWIYHYSCGYDFWQPAGCPMPVLKHCPNCGKQIAKED